MILRRTTISKCLAAGLMVLAASPITASFATCGFSGAHPVGADLRTAVHHATALNVRVLPESTLAGGPAWNALPPFLWGTAMRSVDPTSHIVGRQVLHSILRL